MALQIGGTAWVFGDDINTDLILPGAAFLLPVEEQIKYCFSANRPGWSDQVQPGDIIVAGENFAVGSARPIGNVFQKLGVSGVIAASFNGLGLRNCVNYGIHVLPCPGAADAIGDGDRIAVDWASGAVRNLAQGGEITGKPLPATLLDIAEKGGVIPMLQAEGLLEDAE
tara:strand:- start:409 stop:915 length:507 start_codon:yes stop_codon:yes gene_type:complete